MWESTLAMLGTRGRPGTEDGLGKVLVKMAVQDVAFETIEGP